MGTRTSKASYPAILHLFAYGFAIALPLVVMLGALLFQSASYERDKSRQQILRALGALTDSLDRDLDRYLTILQTLAVSSALQRHDWPAFYEEARAALHGRSYVILIDASGRQVVNTYVPHGQEPPLTGDPEALRRMAETKRPVFSNLRPLNELLPKIFLRWRLDGPRWIKVGFLNKKLTARLEPARHLAHYRAAFGKVVQKRSNRNKVIWRIRWFVVHDVKFANFQIAACNSFHQVGMDVAGYDMPGGSDTLREPFRERSVARANLQATPTRSNAYLQ